jgi:Protein of unknown function (DUF1553)/Protein of unknown function (DUF1549)
MRRCAMGSLTALLTLAGASFAAEPVESVDRLLAKENAGKKVQSAPVVDDLAFLRRVSVDLNGRIPTEAEIQKFLALPASQRRQQLIDEFLKRPQFADRWTVFFADMLRIRSGLEGGGELLALVHTAVDRDMPYDTLARQLISASGKAGMTPEVGYILGDAADPMALASATSEVFLGVRIGCAQCHNHPFDQWTRKQFYDMAAYFGQTRRVEQRFKMRLLGVSVTEVQDTTIMWPPEKPGVTARTPVKASFPFAMETKDGPRQHVARLTALRERQAAAARDAKNKPPSVDDLLGEADSKLKSSGSKDPLDVATEAKTAARDLDVQGDIYKASAMRRELAGLVANPRNRFFARNMVNRVWAELMGRGFVNPIDDFRADNPPSHPETLDYLADEFVASGYNFRTLVRMIVSSEAYQRAHLPMTVDIKIRGESQKAFAAATQRRMFSEALYDSIVQAGHLFEVKHPAGANMVKITTVVREPVVEKGTPATKKPMLPSLVAGKMPAQGGYDLERSIEVDFKDVLKKRGDGIDVDAMRKMSNEEIEAQQMMAMEKPDGKMGKYITRTVTTSIDDNPKFTSSMRMASPAPVGHFLRVFGQTDRAALGEFRDNSPSMRQALMMFNGRLTNEAARVGELEPIARLLTGPKADLDKAIRLAYREALTRDPNEQEMTEAHEIIKGAPSSLEGMADLRWALLNCHEFRYLP